MSKSIITSFLLLIFLSGFSQQKANQTDSVKKKDIRKLSDIILGNINIPDSIVSSPRTEAIVFEINIEKGRVTSVSLWRKDSSILFAMGVVIADKIKLQWKPTYIFPPVIIYPLKISFISKEMGLPAKNDIWSEFFQNLKKREGDKYMILPPPVLNYFINSKKRLGTL